MTDTTCRLRAIRAALLATVLGAAVFVAAGCAAIAPAIPTLLGFAANVLKASGHNHGAQYADLATNFFDAMSAHAEKRDADNAAPALPPLRLDVALVAITNDGARTIEDGATLHTDDRLRILLKAPEAACVYVVNVDGAGTVHPLRPGQNGDPAVAANSQLELPSHGQGFTLNDVTGTEHLYFIATRRRSAELEAALAPFFAETRGRTRDVRAVSQPAVVPGGVDRVERAAVTSRGLDDVVDWHTYLKRAGDLVITRHFRHEE